MGTRYKILIAIFCIYASIFQVSHGCQIEGVTNWITPQLLEILDIHRGDIFRGATSNVLSIVSTTFSDGMNSGPYMDVSLRDSTLILETNKSYELYEEYETAVHMGVTIIMRCSDGIERELVFFVSVKDTNNNYPNFMPDDEFEIEVIPPLPPGYQITTALDEIKVKDIDLTTQRVDFEIIDNPNFEIAYDPASSTTPKEFKAILRTTTFIRNIPEPITVKMKATDVDLTGDPRRSRYATLRIVSSGEFELPAELVFTQTYYMANYTGNSEIILQEPISLRQGYHEEVLFTLQKTDEYSQYFDITKNENNILLRVVMPIPVEVLSQRKLLLVVRADREYTTGTSATVVVQLPEEVNLLFERPIYEGRIVENVLELSQLLLTQGYENQEVSVKIENEYESFFKYSIQGNSITLSMSPLDTDIIEQNSFLNLQIVASTSRNSATTVVTLEIVKQDTVTPVFERTVYSGSYDPESGLSIEQITIVQGYDDTEVYLEGEHADLFDVKRSGQNVELTVSSIPTSLFNEGHLLITIKATKPRTVGANAAITISLPTEASLLFEKPIYEGRIVENVLELSRLLLTQGYENQEVSIKIENEYESFFNYSIQGNRIILSMLPLDTDTIERNTFLNLQIVASTSRSSATTVVTLEIVKQDTVTPVFERAVYSGSYDPESSLSIEHITIVQGYDDTEVHLEGEHADLFDVKRSGQNVELTVSSIPSSLFSEGHLLITIKATKPRTVGANAAIIISLPTEASLLFEKPIYEGRIVENVLELSQLLLTQGYQDQEVSVKIENEFESFFNYSIQGNRITLSMSPLETDIIERNTFLNLQIVASTSRSSAITIVTLEIVKQDTVTPVFERAVYSGSYDPENGLSIEQITIVQGYDDTEVYLDGEHADLFDVKRSGQNVELTVSSIPTSLFSEGHLLITIKATKPRTVGANAAITISLPTESNLLFERPIYEGRIVENALELSQLFLTQGYENQEVSVKIENEYESFFNYSIQGNRITLFMSPLDTDIIEQNSFLNLEIVASTSRSSATTVVTLEIVKQDTVTPIFERAVYSGSYDPESGLSIEQINFVQGYDDTEVYLEGEHADLFDVKRSGQNVELTVSSIPSNLFSEGHLLIAIKATKPRTVGANAAITISLPTEFSEIVVLRFTQPSYIGKIENNTMELPPVLLDGTYGAAIELNPVGEYASYFSLTRQSNKIIVELIKDLPLHVINDNTLISFDIKASYSGAISGLTSIILELVKIPEEQVVIPVFELPYYIGQYSEQGGFVFDYQIQLIQGFDETVSFKLGGDDSRFFQLIESDLNSLTLAISNDSIQQINNTSKLVFSIIADKPGSVSGEAAIIVTLTGFIPSWPLRFAQENYKGLIDENGITLKTIILEEGYSVNVEFSLSGELKEYFEISNMDGELELELLSTLPIEVIGTTNVSILTLHAQRGTTRTHTSIVLELIKQYNETIFLSFQKTYYVGSLNEDELIFEERIALSEDSETLVDYVLEGENSKWFDLIRDESGVMLILKNTIPPAVVVNNQQLLFVITAQKPGSNTARSTIVVLLADNVAANHVLGFERVSYIGSIENTTVNLMPIVLMKGYTSDVEFSLLGELKSYFTLGVQDANVTLSLTTAIPVESIPSSGTIVLEIEASAPLTMSTFATIIFEIVSTDESPAKSELVFEDTFYVGTYTAPATLTFDTSIVLVDGQTDPAVEFALEGDNSQWFELIRGENDVKVTLRSTIPPAVVANNQQLLFVITAQRPGSTTARSTVVVLFTDDFVEDKVLGFDRISYVGSIENTTINLIPIVLREGYTPDVEFTLHGELNSYFTLGVQDATVTLSLTTAIPVESIPSSGTIVLEIEASAPQTMSAFATIIFEIVSTDESPANSELVFEDTFYVGTYTAPTTLTFDTSIVLVDGQADPAVKFALEGDNSQWFELIRGENDVKVTLRSTIPPAIVANNQQLLFVITAQRPGSTTARSTVVVLFTDDFVEDKVLGFDRISYVGSIENTTINLIPIVLREGYTPDVEFTLHGELNSYFTLGVQDATVTLSLTTAIPVESIPSSGTIVLEIEASAPQTMSAFATIIFEIVSTDESPAKSELVFEDTFYVGTYTAPATLTFDTSIVLVDGQADPAVEFALEGDNSQWFELIRGENDVKVTLRSTIPPAVVANNQQLLFIITAQRPGSTTARSTVVVLFTDDFVEDKVLGFDRISYVGSIENTTIKLMPIVLREGYTSDVEFTLHGELNSYFTLGVQDATVTLSLTTAIPVESIPSSGTIVLEIEASAPLTMSAFATIIFEIVSTDESPAKSELVFEDTFYVGTYTAPATLTFDSSIVLVDGQADPAVEFALEGDNSQWFELIRGENDVKVTLRSTIPPAVVANNQQLLFIITAQRPGSTTARSTVVVLFTDDFVEDKVLGFDRISYVGSIENTTIKLMPIVLREGYTSDVEFTLHGELNSYFTLGVQDATVTLSLTTAIPVGSIPSSGTIVLEIEASAPLTMSAFATIIFEIVSTDESPAKSELLFEDTFYVGTYTAPATLTFDTSIVLVDGQADPAVEFALEGDNSQWFELIRGENDVKVTLRSTIPPPVVANNQQLLFIITAQRPGSTTARSTVVVLFTDDFVEDRVLGFDRISYVGSIENTTIKLMPIVLREGYTSDVEFTLHGELNSYFTLGVQDATVTLSLTTAIPVESIPSSGTIVLEIEASAPLTMSAFATIIFEIVSTDESPAKSELVFEDTFYVGTYTAPATLTFDTSIVLVDGQADPAVEFALEGDNSQWFELIRGENDVKVTLRSTIPPAVVANKQQLLFVITAQRPGSTTARSTVVVLFTDDFVEDKVLGFDRISYVGSIENTTINLIPIVLREGYTPDVEFALHGELNSYFTLGVQDATVTLSLTTAIPVGSIPSSGTIVLEIEASAPQTMSAFATIIFEIVSTDESPAKSELVFEDTFYVGTYTAPATLTFDTSIVLVDGQADPAVEFALEGDNSQWFELIRGENDVKVTLRSTIPPAVVANNQQLLFVITAQRPGSTTARSTVVVLFTDDFVEDKVLGFDRISYVGSIENTTIKLMPIVLREGYTSDVEFTLHGELNSYFTLGVQDATVTLSLTTAIPVGSIPSSGTIVLEIEASAPQTMSAFATIIFEIVSTDESPAKSELVFEDTFYVGTYTAPATLTFDTSIVLVDGQADPAVEFALEGDNSQWFELIRGENDVKVTLRSTIPPPVVANNQQLLFIITAQRPGSTTARSTVVVLFTDDFVKDKVLGFDRISYVGSIENTTIKLMPIVLREGYTSDVEFTLHGELNSYFTLGVQDATVTLSLTTAIPVGSIPSSGTIVLEIEASAPQTMSAFATIIFEIVSTDESPAKSELVFEDTFYVGTYTAPATLTFDTSIVLVDGQADPAVEFALEGDNSQWFELIRGENDVKVTLRSTIPPAVVANNQQLLFIITAQRPGSTTARSTVVVLFTNDFLEDKVLGFDLISYVGSIENTTVKLMPIVLREGYTPDVEFTLHGELYSYFTLGVQDATVTLSLTTAIPVESIPSSGTIVLEIEASAPLTMSTFATIIFHVVSTDESPAKSELVFEDTFYVGSYTAPATLTFDTSIVLVDGQTDPAVEFALEGDNSQWFELIRGENDVKVTLRSTIPPAVVANNQQLLFIITAQRPGSTTARSTVVVLFTDDFVEDKVLGFDRISYVGSIENTTVNLIPIVLREGYTPDVEFTLHGELNSYFTLGVQDATVTLSLTTAIPVESIPSSGTIVLEIEASAPQTMSAFATIIFEIVSTDESPAKSELVFEDTFYVGTYTAPATLTFDTSIVLVDGQADPAVEFALEGDNTQWFELIRGENYVNVTLRNTIPPAIVANNQQLLFVITAQRPGSNTARSTIIILFEDGSETDPSVSFNKILYEGRIQNGIIQHETIILTGYEGTDVEIAGVYSTSFTAKHTDGAVVIETVGTLILPPNTQHLALEIRADDTGAVLLLEVSDTETPIIPVVTFRASSYVIRAEVGQTGRIGHVQAEASNGESIVYSLKLENEHLQARLSISHDGQLLLSAPVNSGFYNFQAIATTVFTHAEAFVPVYFTVEAITTCGENDIVTTPLIVIDRDEEQSHQNLVVLNSTQHVGCRYSITNSWPTDQNWLYVDNTGLHTNAIDREHPSIAFMALSQVQVKLTLECETDKKRTKRSADTRLDSLGPYDYGPNSWIISNTIDFNSRRTIVNLIVNDINDNTPIFVGKENEPIVVGYPVTDLLPIILPRSLVELQATDADVGENAAIVYWSSEPQLAVSSTTGFVHVKNGETLTDDMRLIVSATDLNGQGRTGTISLKVKLLYMTDIAVLSVRGGFLEDESRILSNISTAIGYEVKSLRSTVILDSDYEQQETRKKRNISGTLGATLEIYLYGLMEGEPVPFDTLLVDIKESVSVIPVDISSMLSLEEHLEGQLTGASAGNNIGLLVSTIILSVLLFLILVAAAVWYIIYWRRNKEYNKFEEDSNTNSEIDTANLENKPDNTPMPRLNIEELKKSEKRLQEMLQAPVEEVTVEPTTSAINSEKVTSLPDTINAPIVIQDKLKDAEESDNDEFGEKKEKRRKSVVTFNENVEKIIHLQETPDVEKSESDFETYQF